MSGFWMVRAGERGYLIDDFVRSGCVAVGWDKLNDLSHVRSKEELIKLNEKAYPEYQGVRLAGHIAGIYKFRFVVEPGDTVVSYDPSQREYVVGEITGDYSYEPGRVPDYHHVRSVKWKGRVNRDDLTVPSRNTLGSTLTIFEPGDSVRAEIEARLAGQPKPVGQEDDETEVDEIRRDVLGKAHEFIKDRIRKLDWDDMQELVAAILRAMGYRTRVSPKGSDRGKDIVASPDGLGLEQPRIKAEVKHRGREQIGANEIRSFIGGLRQNDRGLYVSTGGFSKEANYEADRSPVPVTLLDLDEVAILLVQHYDGLDAEGRALVPLVRVLWPAS